MRKNLKVFRTTYDGFIITLSKSGTINAYEGVALCPKKLQEWLKNNKPIKIHAFCNEAINYGYIA